MRRILDLIESAYQGRVYLYSQELKEVYPSGKSTVTVIIGTFTWREGTNPNNGNNTFTFTACNGTTTTVVPAYAGTLSLTNDRQLKDWCPR